MMRWKSEKFSKEMAQRKSVRLNRRKLFSIERPLNYNDQQRQPQQQQKKQQKKLQTNKQTKNKDSFPFITHRFGFIYWLSLACKFTRNIRSFFACSCHRTDTTSSKEDHLSWQQFCLSFNWIQWPADDLKSTESLYFTPMGMEAKCMSYHGTFGRWRDISDRMSESDFFFRFKFFYLLFFLLVVSGIQFTHCKCIAELELDRLEMRIGYRVPIAHRMGSIAIGKRLRAVYRVRFSIIADNNSVASQQMQMNASLIEISQW